RTHWIDDKEGRHVYEHGLALSRNLQEQDRLLNCHAFAPALDPVPDDPWDALKRLTSARRPYTNMPSDMKAVLRGTAEIGRGLHRRHYRHRPQLERKMRTELHIILEQAPDLESRVVLSSEKRDVLEMPISQIRWKTTDLERRTAARSAQL